MTNPQKAQFLTTMVAVARSQKGVEEIPRGSNSGNIVRGYLRAVGINVPASWCMAFCVWVALAALRRLGLAAASCLLSLTGSCQQQVDHAKGKGLAVSAADVLSGKVKLLPGWLMCVWENGGDPKSWYHYCHTGVVTQVNADGTFVSCEGNTNDSGGRQGYAVMEHMRRIADNAEDGHAKYCFIMTA